MKFVLDASVTLAWCFGDEGGTYAPAVLEALRSESAVVAPHWGIEVANGLLVAERLGRIRADAAMEATRLILSLPIEVDPGQRRRPFEATHRFARNGDLTAFDAAYLELAARTALPLASINLRLVEAAEREGVAAFQP